jgi:hypothetical protein
MIAPENSLLKDPRVSDTFQPYFFPLSDLSEFPPGNPEKKNNRIRLEFLILYYEINLVSARLIDPKVRTDSEKQRSEQQLKSLRRDLQQLEDYYAPLGVIAEPRIAKGFAVNLTFTFPDESRWFHEQAATGRRNAELKFSRAETESSGVADK